MHIDTKLDIDLLLVILEHEASHKTSVAWMIGKIRLITSQTENG